MILPALQTPKNRTSKAYPDGETLQRDVQLVQDLVTCEYTLTSTPAESAVLTLTPGAVIICQ